MTVKDKKNIASTIDNEGFNYAFIHYSDFNEIHDPNFHKLREQYVKASEALKEYIEYEKYSE